MPHVERPAARVDLAVIATAAQPSARATARARGPKTPPFLRRSTAEEEEGRRPGRADAKSGAGASLGGVLRRPVIGSSAVASSQSGVERRPGGASITPARGSARARAAATLSHPAPQPLGGDQAGLGREIEFRGLASACSSPFIQTWQEPRTLARRGHILAADGSAPARVCSAYAREVIQTETGGGHQAVATPSAYNAQLAALAPPRVGIDPEA